MPSKCCVPGCTSNYVKPFVNVFSFPKDPVTTQTWLRAIHRDDYSVSKNSRVCIKHFDERYIIREESVTRPDGSILTVKRDRLKLRDDAVPTVFENLPTYLTKTLPTERKNPEERKLLAEQRLELKKKQEDQLDTVESFECLIRNYKTKLDFNDENLYHKVFDNQLVFFKVALVDNQYPSIIHSLNITNDLGFYVVKNNILIKNEAYLRTFSANLKVDKWSKLRHVVLSVFKENVPIAQVDKLRNVNDLLDDISDSIDFDSNARGKLRFLKEQLNLAISKKIKYCSETLVWFATIFYCFPGAYRNIRESKLLTMPHPRYLQSFTSKIGTGSSGIDSSHIRY